MSEPSLVDKLTAHARGDVGTPAEMAALEQRMGSLLGEPPPVAPPAASGSPAASIALGTAAVIVAALGLYFEYAPSQEPEERAPIAAPRTTHAAPVAEPVPSSAERGAPIAEQATQPVEQPTPAVEEPAPIAAPPSEPIAPAHPRASRHTAATPEAPAVEPPEAPDELALITRARSLLRRDPAAALEALNEHERAFPNGMLAEERASLEPQALSALGRGDEARERARAFLERYPESAYRERVAQSLVPEQAP